MGKYNLLYNHKIFHKLLNQTRIPASDWETEITFYSIGEIELQNSNMKGRIIHIEIQNYCYPL